MNPTDPEYKAYCRTLTPAAALEESIAHWRRMRDDPFCEESPGYAHCALCRRYRRCADCPVAAKAHAGCHGSPHGDACRAWNRLRGPKAANADCAHHASRRG